MINEEDIFWMKLKALSLVVVIAHEHMNYMIGAKKNSMWTALCWKCRAKLSLNNLNEFYTLRESPPKEIHHWDTSTKSTHIFMKLPHNNNRDYVRGNIFGEPNEKHLWYNTLQVCSWSLQVSMWCWKTLLCYIN